MVVLCRFILWMLLVLLKSCLNCSYIGLGISTKPYLHDLCSDHRLIEERYAFTLPHLDE